MLLNRPLFCLLAALLSAGLACPVFAAGNLDRGFGDGGRRIVVFDSGGDDMDDALAMDVASDGTVVLAGSTRLDATRSCLAVARLKPDGTLDTTFSTDGRFTLPAFCDGATVRINAVKIDSANRIVFAGYYQATGTDPEFIVGRIKADGSGLDDSFGSFPTLGVTAPNLGGDNGAVANALALQSDGKIVAAGYATTNFIGTLTGYAVVRLNANGTQDTGFGTSGYQLYSWGSSLSDPLNDQATAVTIQGDGKIVVAGTSQQTATGADFGVIRLNANGSFDTGFGGNGTGAKLIDFAGSCKDDIATAVAARYSLFNPAGDGIVIAGTTCVSGNDWDFAVAVLDRDGQLDASFNGSGRRAVSFDIGGANRDVAKSLALESIADFLLFPTHITLGGFALNTQTAGAGYDFVATRLNFSGGVDTRFGSNGRAVFGQNLGGSNDDFANALSVRGRNAWLAGSLRRSNPGDYDFGVLRLFANDVIFGSRFEKR